MIEPWQRRAPEEANLFNPAFMGALACEYAKEHIRQRDESAPLTYLLIAYAIVLHAPTRLRLPKTTITSLLAWSQENEDLLVGFPSRQSGVRPYALEGIRFAIGASALELADGHALRPGSRKVTFGAAFRRTATAETTEVIERMKFAARWFAKSGSEATVLSAWRCRP
ncbi:hypothetical protein DEM26_14515 [Thioclava sp. NG1]|uniref:three component ABC system middle component n=1 Tax=Thioclava sp. NG1 TaxID=2182426 RepID=UPI000D6115C2|nr:three component ABC system middle component [Thioclava sp. NG1]PWE49071.1 hypothetical protein DEM26_14515 [Thioclava sp. NG1]